MSETLPPIQAVTNVADLIREVEASLPPEKRSVGSFLALAETALAQLEEATKAVFIQVAGDALNLYDFMFNSALDNLADTIALWEVGEQVKLAFLDAAKARVRLQESIATLKELDPTSKPPLTVAEVFYYVPDAGTPYVPLYTAPYRFMSQAQAAWSVYTSMKGTFAVYMVAEIRDRAVELAKAAVNALTPRIPLALVAAALVGAGYYLATRKPRR